MSDTKFSELTNRALLKLTGSEARDFLQNLVSNDLSNLSSGQAVYSALLTPQGKFLFDFFIVDSGDALLIDTDKGRAGDLLKRLTMYKLRSDVVIEDVSADLAVYALFGGTSSLPTIEGGIATPDPRLDALGARLYGPKNAFMDLTASLQEASLDAYTAHRLSLGVPEGPSDIQVEKNFLLEANFEELNGVSFSKGCYIGQELTARTKYRAKIRKRLFQFTYDGKLEVGSPITAGEKEIATVTSFQKPFGLAMTRLDAFEKAIQENTPLNPEGVNLFKPDYVVLPEKTDSE